MLRTKKILNGTTDDEEEEDEEEEEMTRHVLEQMEKMLVSLTRRMMKSEMEDFELVSSVVKGRFRYRRRDWRKDVSITH